MLTQAAVAVAQAGDLDRAEALARTIPGPGDQARALTELATSIARAGDLDRAARLLARALIMDPLEIWWVKTVCRFFPSVIGGIWDILAGAYTT